jgi:hypothetical protein
MKETMDHFNLGAHTRKISTTSPEAQHWFNYGLNWCFGFNHEEGVKCFQKALESDPACVSAQVMNETLLSGQWAVEDGLPLNKINKIVQTQDDYLWLATFDGLVRFDGVQFTVFNASNTEGLPSNRITDIIEDRTGNIWLRTHRTTSSGPIQRGDFYPFPHGPWVAWRSYYLPV